MSTTQTTITKKQENKGAKGILDLTSQLSQVLKQFSGIYDKELPECDGLTVEQWMHSHRVKRYVNSKTGAKKGYTPALLLEGWCGAMKQNVFGKTQAFLFKNVPAKYVLGPARAAEWGLDADTKLRVFTKEEAEKIDGKPISKYMLVPVDDNKWSVTNILRGLRQGNNFEKENTKRADSDKKWNELEHVYIVRNIKQNDGTLVRKVIEVRKDMVEF